MMRKYSLVIEGDEGGYSAYVPEPSTQLLSLAGLLYLLIRLKKRPLIQGDLASQS